MPLKTVGKTKDTGYQFGIRRTFNLKAEVVWEMLFSPEGQSIWLGEPMDGDFLPSDFVTFNGISVSVRVWNPGSHIRIQYQRQDWEKLSILQIRVIPKGEKTTVSFHQDHLMDASMREEMKIHWKGVFERLNEHLKSD
jgi:uncharacterized protein YndB with AHSA1/START domain